jgi:hypothetical protein
VGEQLASVRPHQRRDLIDEHETRGTGRIPVTAVMAGAIPQQIRGRGSDRRSQIYE